MLIFLIESIFSAVSKLSFQLMFKIQKKKFFNRKLIDIILKTHVGFRIKFVYLMILTFLKVAFLISGAGKSEGYILKRKGNDGHRK